ncbi:MAG TPA: single-stranded DNA-binding protein [Candidatus Sumerlaeota bacterium]|nr:single-stranded DNA-binding protein [Candidatus Sumerlaeota bacterium]HPS01332.1 single-stranded DNA-binding protein [Candidatus Sumerlaeota bacterium]
MLELNKVMLIGNLTRDPELSYTTSGTALAKLGLAVNRRTKNRQTNEWQDETAFVDVDAWTHTAEFCAKYLKKGSRVFVEGRLRQHSWEAQDGSKRSKLSVTAERVEFADSKPSSQPGAGGAPAYGAAPQAAPAYGTAPVPPPQAPMGYQAPQPPQAAGFPQPRYGAPQADEFAPPPDDNTADDLPF